MRSTRPSSSYSTELGTFSILDHGTLACFFEHLFTLLPNAKIQFAEKIQSRMKIATTSETDRRLYICCNGAMLYAKVRWVTCKAGYASLSITKRDEHQRFSIHSLEVMGQFLFVARIGWNTSNHQRSWCLNNRRSTIEIEKLKSNHFLLGVESSGIRVEISDDETSENEQDRGKSVNPQ